jgi:hypothetical protein
LLDPISKANPLDLLSQTERRIYGIDFKNPFTMSNTRGVPLKSPLLRAANRFSSSLDIFGRASRAVRRWPILEECAAALLLRLSSCDLVEPIGIEPMT